jgi:hypothetical protein
MYERFGLDIVDVRSNPDRRTLSGSVLSSSGLMGISTGGCTLFFERDVVLLAVGHVDNALRISYDSILQLQFGGRGVVSNTTDGGWVGGGFGLSGALKGAAIANLMNALTTRTTTSIETVINFAWDGGSIALLNTTWPPSTVATLFTPVIVHIKDVQERSRQHSLAQQHTLHQTSASGDIVDRLTQLADLHRMGALTDEEFSIAKKQIIGHAF